MYLVEVLVGFGGVGGIFLRTDIQGEIERMESLLGKSILRRGDRRSREFDDFEKQRGQWGLREGSEGVGGRIQVRQGLGGCVEDFGFQFEISVWVREGGGLGFRRFCRGVVGFCLLSVLIFLILVVI